MILSGSQICFRQARNRPLFYGPFVVKHIKDELMLAIFDVVVVSVIFIGVLWNLSAYLPPKNADGQRAWPLHLRSVVLISIFVWATLVVVLIAFGSRVALLPALACFSSMCVFCVSFIKMRGREHAGRNKSKSQ